MISNSMKFVVAVLLRTRLRNPRVFQQLPEASRYAMFTKRRMVSVFKLNAARYKSRGPDSVAGKQPRIFVIVKYRFNQPQRCALAAWHKPKPPASFGRTVFGVFRSPRMAKYNHSPNLNIWSSNAYTGSVRSSHRWPSAFVSIWQRPYISRLFAAAGFALLRWMFFVTLGESEAVGSGGVRYSSKVSYVFLLIWVELSFRQAFESLVFFTGLSRFFLISERVYQWHHSASWSPQHSLYSKEIPSTAINSINQ